MDKDFYGENKLLYRREIIDPLKSYPVGMHYIHLNCSYAQTVDFTNPPPPEDGMDPADWMELLKFAHDFVTRDAEQMLLPEMAALKRAAVSRLLGA